MAPGGNIPNAERPVAAGYSATLEIGQLDCCAHDGVALLVSNCTLQVPELGVGS
ncbi:hypothetical protein HRbin20_01586 [bacterium HR20]|nr:hypothetical protein HRbin20_01586 [bacterium HR20]